MFGDPVRAVDTHREALELTCEHPPSGFDTAPGRLASNRDFGEELFDLGPAGVGIGPAWPSRPPFVVVSEV